MKVWLELSYYWYSIPACSPPIFHFQIREKNRVLSREITTWENGGEPSCFWTPIRDRWASQRSE